MNAFVSGINNDLQNHSQDITKKESKSLYQNEIFKST